MPKTKAQQENGEPRRAEEIDTPQMKIRVMETVIYGRSPLICHSKRHLADELKDRQGLEIKEKDERDPDMEFRQSLYPLPPDAETYVDFVNGDLELEDVDGFGIKAIALKKAMVRASKNQGVMPMTEARSAFFVNGTDFMDFLTIQSPSPPHMREDTVSLPRGGTDLRFRGTFNEWACDIVIEYDANMITGNQIPYLIQAAGFGVGIGDWRPEKDGQFGRFMPAQSEDVGPWYNSTF